MEWACCAERVACAHGLAPVAILYTSACTQVQRPVLVWTLISNTELLPNHNRTDELDKGSCAIVLIYYIQTQHTLVQGAIFLATLWDESKVWFIIEPLSVLHTIVFCTHLPKQTLNNSTFTPHIVLSRNANKSKCCWSIKRAKHAS